MEYNIDTSNLKVHWLPLIGTMMLVTAFCVGLDLPWWAGALATGILCTGMNEYLIKKDEILQAETKLIPQALPPVAVIPKRKRPDLRIVK